MKTGAIGKVFLLSICYAFMPSVYAYGAEAVQLPPNVNGGNIEDPAMAAGVLNDFCRQKMSATGSFTDEEAALLREMLFSGQYSDKLPSAMRSMPKETMDRFIKEAMRCAVTADTLRALQEAVKDTGVSNAK